MDIRQYDLWIDGVLVPEDFLEDRETQLEHSAILIFNAGRVMNYDSQDELIAPHAASFARLREVVIDFVLRNGDGPRPSVTIFCIDTNLHWQLFPGYDIHRFETGTPWSLEWGSTYMFFQNLGRADQRSMSLRVERSRQPLAPLHGNVPRRALRDRFEVEDTADNAENVY